MKYIYSYFELTLNTFSEPCFQENKKGSKAKGTYSLSDELSYFPGQSCANTIKATTHRTMIAYTDSAFFKDFGYLK